MHRDEVRHALRTPLTVIKGVLRLLQYVSEEQLPRETRIELLDRANAQVARLEEALRSVEAHFPDQEDDVIVLHEEVTRL